MNILLKYYSKLNDAWEASQKDKKNNKLFSFGYFMILMSIPSTLWMVHELDLFVHCPDPVNHPLGKETFFVPPAFAAIGIICVMINQSVSKK